MDAGNLPLWVQAAGSLAGTGLVAVWLALKERTKERAEAKPDARNGEAQVIAGSIMGSRELHDLGLAVRGLDGNMRSFHETVGRVEQLLIKIDEQLHDDFMLRVTRGDRP
jgi:hypothetical protein